jgi:hypothetical protein
MSGLPYAWDVIYGGINQTGATQVAQASTLAKIYQQLFLALSWQQAAEICYVSLSFLMQNV